MYHLICRKTKKVIFQGTDYKKMMALKTVMSTQLELMMLTVFDGGGEESFRRQGHLKIVREEGKVLPFHRVLKA